jgi:hypothetical protein
MTMLMTILMTISMTVFLSLKRQSMQENSILKKETSKLVNIDIEYCSLFLSFHHFMHSVETFVSKNI